MTTDLLIFNPIAHSPIINLYLEGVTIESLSQRFSLPLSIILEIIDLPESKRLQTSIIANTGYNSASKRALLIERMIDKKLEEQGNEPISNKDLSTLLRLAIENARVDKEPAAKTQVNIDNSQTSNYEKLLGNIMEAEVVTEEVKK